MDLLKIVDPWNVLENASIRSRDRASIQTSRHGRKNEERSSLHKQLINPRRACAARVTVLGLCVCVSVTQHLTFHVFIHATNDTNLLGGG